MSGILNIPAIADAVAAALNARTFTASFKAQRAYLPTFELKDLAELRVSVVPKADESSAASRKEAQHDVQIDVAVQKKLSSGRKDEAAEIDGLMGLVQEIAAALWEAGRFAGVAALVRTENSPIYAPEHLREMRLFTSLLTLTLRVMTS